MSYVLTCDVCRRLIEVPPGRLVHRWLNRHRSWRWWYWVLPPLPSSSERADICEDCLREIGKRIARGPYPPEPMP